MRFISLLAFLLISACGDDVIKPTVHAVLIVPGLSVMDKPLQLMPMVNGDVGVIAGKVTWTSSDTTLATVSQDGFLSARCRPGGIVGVVARVSWREGQYMNSDTLFFAVASCGIP